MAVQANTWYEARLILDSQNRFRVIVWQRDNPAVWAENTLTRSEWSGQSWKFASYAYTASQRVDIEFYQEGALTATWQRTGMTDGSGSTAWQYDSRGRMTQEIKTINGTNYQTNWTYNSADLPVTIQYPADSGGNRETVTTSYMNNGMLNTLSGTNTYVGSVVYDAAGRVTSRRVGTLSLYTTFSYYGWDEGYPAGRLETIQTGARQNLTYTYNNDGNITTITDAVNSNQVQTFGYDDLHRLTSAVTSAVGSGQYTTQSYTYDSATGNLEMKGSLSLDYEQNQQPTAPYHGVKSSSNGNTYAYDANGNMVTRVIGTTTYTLIFDVANRLVEVKTNGVTSAQMVYDGDGNRVKTVISGVTTTYIGNYFETNGTTIKKYYYYGSTRVAMRSGSTLYFLLADHLGSTTMFLNSSGGRVTELMYSPWGENRFTYGLAPSTFQYTGQRNDSVAGGLYYYGARYFDSAVGRFFSADTAVPGAGNAMAWDRYAYVFNSLVNLVDDDGHEPHGPGVPDGYDQYGFGDVPSNDWWAYSCATIDTRIMDSVSNSPEFIQTIVEAAIAPESPLSGYLHVSFSQIEILSGDFEQGFHDLAVSVGTNLYNGSIGLAVGGDLQPALGSGNAYSITYETYLPETAYPGNSRQYHNQLANQALLLDMADDPYFALSMNELIPGVTNQITTNPRSSPANWTWHHNPYEPGLMQLVPRIQHESPLLWRFFYDDSGRGGFANWGR